MNKNDDVKKLEQDVIKLHIELSKTKQVVGTLVSWMVSQIGEEAAKKLLDDLNA